MPVNKDELAREFLANRQDKLAMAERLIDEALTARYDPTSGRPVTIDMSMLAREMGFTRGESIPQHLLSAIKALYEGQEWMVSVHSEQRDNYIAFI